MPLDSKHTEANFSPNSTDLLLLQFAQVPRPPDLVVGVSTTMTTKTYCIYYPTRMRRGKVIGRVVVVVDTKIAKSGDVRT